jgi:NhaP-type Na+/H+ or K+/H+ antiporter
MLTTSWNSVVLSMLMALIWYKMPGLSSGLSFNNETFFLVLLPFIIFESGFSVHRQSLFRNMGSILMFAIIGTFLSAFGIGGFLYATVKARGAPYDFSFLDCMIIGAIMSSTDPVATLSIVRTSISILN